MPVTFKPRPSDGYRFGIVLMILMAIPLVIPLVLLAIAPVSVGPLVFIAIMVLLVEGLLGYITWAYRTLQYEIGDDGLLVRWGHFRDVVSYADILGVKEAKSAFRWLSVFKLAASSWPGYHVGTFYLGRKQGVSKVYATRGPVAVIRTRQWDVVVSPEDVSGFIQALRKKIGDIDDWETAKEPFRLLSPVRDPWFVGLVLLSLAVIAGTVLFLLDRIPRLPPSVPLHFDLEGRPNRFGSPSELYFPVIIQGVTTFILMILGLALGRYSRLAGRILAATILTMVTLMAWSGWLAVELASK